MDFIKLLSEIASLLNLLLVPLLFMIGKLIIHMTEVRAFMQISKEDRASLRADLDRHEEEDRQTFQQIRETMERNQREVMQTILNTGGRH